jgi:hypothetical protein
VSATSVPRPPDGALEVDAQPGELSRWRYKTSAGDLTVALYADPPRVQWWTGPGHAECETDDPGVLWQLCVLFEELGNWVSDLTQLSRAEGQGSLFEEATA